MENEFKRTRVLWRSFFIRFLLLYFFRQFVVDTTKLSEYLQNVSNRVHHALAVNGNHAPFRTLNNENSLLPRRGKRLPLVLLFSEHWRWTHSGNVPALKKHLNLEFRNVFFIHWIWTLETPILNSVKRSRIWGSLIKRSSRRLPVNRSNREKIRPYNRECWCEQLLVP